MTEPTGSHVGLEVKTTTCYMCACRCGIRVKLKDGEIRYIEGNPEHPLNKGVMCAKGASGIMKQYSPARLTKPLLRKPDAERGSGEFREIEWDEAFEIMTERLGRLRASDPKQFAVFTGRDQMQALTGLFASSSAHRTTRPTAVSAPSTWQPALSTRWAARSGNSAGPTWSVPSCSS